MQLMAKFSAELKETCKKLFIKGWSIGEISKDTGVGERTLYQWRDKGQWEMYSAPDTIEQAISRRINVLAERENKSRDEIDELAKLAGTFGDLKINLAKAGKLEAEARQVEKGGYIPAEFYNADAAPTNQKPQPKKRRRKKLVKNDISSITPDMLDELRLSIFFEYQLLWFAVKNNTELCRNRFIVKSRQIGATYYFAWEALDDAIRTGDNQIFLSASRDQSEVFKAYIIAFAIQHFEIELKGQGVIKLSNGAELRFLSTNSRTAQSYHGHLYLDEVFWIPDYEKLWKVASGMAAHKKWRRCQFSTPSAMSHQAHPMWSGEKYNKNRADNKKVEFDVSHKALKHGALGADKIWRHMVTVEDAEKQGCDLFDIDELRTEYNKDDFDNLFLCKFIDDARSVFSLAMLMRCMTDSEGWEDYYPDSARPFGNRPVALGYDPSRVRDNATLSTLSIPLKQSEKWRVLTHKNYHGQNFQYQANRIKEQTESHNVKHIGIDITGIGYGVFELVEKFYRRATPINYSIQTKTELVLKALDVIENGRFEYSAGNKEITQAFMMITRTTTPSGQVTYASGRSNSTGHADVAWSIMHALNYEAIAPRNKTSVAFSD